MSAQQVLQPCVIRCQHGVSLLRPRSQRHPAPGERQLVRGHRVVAGVDADPVRMAVRQHDRHHQERHGSGRPGHRRLHRTYGRMLTGMTCAASLVSNVEVSIWQPVSRVSKISPSDLSEDAHLFSDHHEEAADPLHRQLPAARALLLVSGLGVVPHL